MFLINIRLISSTGSLAALKPAYDLLSRSLGAKPARTRMKDPNLLSDRRADNIIIVDSLKEVVMVPLAAHLRLPRSERGVQREQHLTEAYPGCRCEYLSSSVLRCYGRLSPSAPLVQPLGEIR